MTIISNPFAPACGYLPQKYTISTLQPVDIADNQDSYGCILKFSRFTKELMRKLCYPNMFDAPNSTGTIFAIYAAKILIFNEVVKTEFRRRC